MTVNRRDCTFPTEALLPTHKDCNTSSFEPRGKTGIEKISFSKCQAMCTGDQAFQWYLTGRVLLVPSAVYSQKFGADGLHSGFEVGSFCGTKERINCQSAKNEGSERCGRCLGIPM